MEAKVAARPSQRPYSDHDTQKRGAASFDRDDINDGSSGVEFRLQTSLTFSVAWTLQWCSSRHSSMRLVVLP